MDELNAQGNELITCLQNHPHIMRKYDQATDFVADLGVALSAKNLFKKMPPSSSDGNSLREISDELNGGDT